MRGSSEGDLANPSGTHTTLAEVGQFLEATRAPSRYEAYSHLDRSLALRLLEAQQILGGIVLAEALQGPCRYGQLLPVRRQERFEQGPIPYQARTIFWLIHSSTIHDSCGNK